MQKIWSFTRNPDGSLAVVVALAFPVVLVAGGMAVDMGFAIAARSDLAYVSKLACSRYASRSPDDAANQSRLRYAESVIGAHLPKTLLNGNATNISMVSSSAGMSAVGTSMYRPKFGKLFGIRSVGLRWTEACPSELRVPTNAASVSCDATVPDLTPGGTETMTLGDARAVWQSHNEDCSSGSCIQPPAPDEMIVTIAIEANGAIIERDLLSDSGGRGAQSVNYTNLPAGTFMTLQPLDGFPTDLPDACFPSAATPLPPPPPPAPAAGGGGTGCVPLSTFGGGGINTGFSGSGPAVSGGSSASTAGANANASGAANGTTGWLGTNTSSTTTSNGSSSSSLGCAVATNGTATAGGSASAGGGSSSSSGGSGPSSNSSVTGTASGSFASTTFSMSSCTGSSCAGMLAGSPSFWLP